MKLQVSCVPLTIGGGVQVAIAFLVGLRALPDVTWQAILPLSLRSALPDDLTNDPRLIFVNRRSQADRIWLSPWLHVLERRFKPDVVFSVFGPPFYIPRAPQLVGFALPHMIYENLDPARRSSLKDKISDWVRCRLFRRADYLVVETETARQRLAVRLSIPSSRIFVVPNSPNPLLRRLPDRSPQPGDRFVILIPSAYYRHKNLEIVPRVAQQIRLRAPDVDFEFRLTLPKDGAEWRAISSDAAKAGVSDRILTLGVVRITELASAYRDASAVFLPTLREVSTAVYPESFFFKRPLVTTDMDFARELCGDAALFFKPTNAEMAATRLIELARSTELRQQLVEAGEQQLLAGYPLPETKFHMQMDLLRRVAERKI